MLSTESPWSKTGLPSAVRQQIARDLELGRNRRTCEIPLDKGSPFGLLRSSRPRVASRYRLHIRVAHRSDADFGQIEGSGRRLEQGLGIICSATAPFGTG